MEENDYSQHASGGGSTGGVAQSGSGPAAAGGGAAAAEGGAAATHGGDAKVEHGFGERVKPAPWWSKLIGVLAILLSGVATVLFVLDETPLAVASYIVGLVAILVAAVPLFRG